MITHRFAEQTSKAKHTVGGIIFISISSNANMLTVELHYTRCLDQCLRVTYHNIKLLRLRNQLHTTIVNNDLIVLDTGILGSNFPARFQKQTISKFHNVGFVHGCHFFSVVQVGILKCIFCNPLRAKFRHHLANAKPLSLPNIIYKSHEHVSKIYRRTMNQ